MNWTIIYTIEAETDVDNIYNYIVSEWNDLDTAKTLIRQIIAVADSLEQMPLRHQIWDNEPWLSQKIRYFPVEKYIIFYKVNEKQKVVNILRILYGGRDVSEQLAALKEVQEQFAGAAQKAGIKSADDVNALVKKIRKERAGKNKK